MTTSLAERLGFGADEASADATVRMPLYFAYGSNMDRDAMAARCPASRPLGPARLPRHRLVLMREGYLSVVPDPRGEVLGVLWDMALADVPALDRYEEVGSGLYRKRLVPVLSDAGPRRALIYVGQNAGPGFPLPGYLAGVLEAGRAAGLPERYLASIAALGPARGSGAGERDGPRPARPRPDPPAVRPTRGTPLHPPRPQTPANWSWTP